MDDAFIQCIAYAIFLDKLSSMYRNRQILFLSKENEKYHKTMSTLSQFQQHYLLQFRYLTLITLHSYT